MHCVITTANLCFCEGVQPKFSKSCKLPFALKLVVRDELDRLVTGKTNQEHMVNLKKGLDGLKFVGLWRNVVRSADALVIIQKWNPHTNRQAQSDC